VLIRAISGRRLRMNGQSWRPVAMKGWSRVVFAADRNGHRRIMGIDELIRHLDDWEKNE
jgi:hypothetical protein